MVIFRSPNLVFSERRKLLMFKLSNLISHFRNKYCQQLSRWSDVDHYTITKLVVSLYLIIFAVLFADVCLWWAEVSSQNFLLHKVFQHPQHATSVVIHHGMVTWWCTINSRKSYGKPHTSETGGNKLLHLDFWYFIPDDFWTSKEFLPNYQICGARLSVRHILTKCIAYKDTTKTTDCSIK